MSGGLVRLGAVGYLNARPLVYGLEQDPRFQVRYDLPSECARLLHAHEIDLGLIPSIEYLRGPRPYGIVLGAGVTSKGPVKSVALYTRREPRDIRTVAMDTSSRTSVALVTIFLNRTYRSVIEPVAMAPNLELMLERADAALIIGDVALFLDHEAAGVQKIDLGEVWTRATGLPFVYALWAGWPHAVTPEDIAVLLSARQAGVAHVDDIAAEHAPGDSARQAVISCYLRDNIRYRFDGEQQEGLETFYSYANELGLASYDGELRIYHADYGAY
jgi:predicted solute-binding protein